MSQMRTYNFDNIENIVGKVENAGYALSPFHAAVSKDSGHIVLPLSVHLSVYHENSTFSSYS